MNPRLLLVAAAGAVLVGFALVDVRGSSTDPQLFRANHERWQSMPEPEREALRERFRRFSALPPGEQEALEQRSATLRRLRTGLTQVQGHEPTAEEAAAALASRVEKTRKYVALKDIDAATTAELLTQLDGRTRRCIGAFFDNLERHGRVPSEELARLRAQSLPEQLRDALLLMKNEQISLYAEGVRPDEADALMSLPPLDVAARAERRRREQGFLGNLAYYAPLTEDERMKLSDASSSLEFKEQLRDMKSEKIREVLATQGRLPPERIEALLIGPVNELEREADEVLSAPGATAAY